jgi:hypothetical protein
MENIKLDVNELLRYGSGGAVFIITYTLLSYSMDDILNSDPSGEWVTLLILVSYVIGIILYTLHRAFLYPIPMRIIHVALTKGEERKSAYGCFWKVTDFERDLNIDRWKRHDKGDSRYSVQVNLDRWGAHTHMLYVMTLSMFIGAYASPSTEEAAIRSGTIWVAIVIAFIAAVANDIRCISMDIAIMRLPKQ